jgi:hypothetical protein
MNWSKAAVLAHRCFDRGPNGEECKQPGFHFVGSDWEWSIFMGIATGNQPAGDQRDEDDRSD